MVTGMIIDYDSPLTFDCDACKCAKMHVHSFPPEAKCKYTEIGEMTFTDVWGPACTSGINRERYYVPFTDGATRRTILYFLKQKSEVEEKIKNYITYILTQTGKRCKAF